MKDEVKQIMFDKLNEMSEEKFVDEACYNGCCSIMNDIAQALLQCDCDDDKNENIKEKQENAGTKKSLKDYSIEELAKELISRDGVSTTSFEHYCIGEDKPFKTLAIELKYDWKT